jgi:sortase A
MRRLLRIAGTVMIAAGVLVLAWTAVVWRWQDPFSALYTHVQQNRLESRYEDRAEAYRPPTVAHGDLASVRQALAVDARAYRRSLHRGDAVGRLRVGRIGLDMVVVQGTDDDTLKKGPGHYSTTGLPGEGRLVYVAGHRTTYLAPFSHIDDVRTGDYARLELPYGTFTYRVTRHYVVGEHDLRVLADRGAEVLRLQACHPRFFASHRYIVDAKLVSIEPRGGRAYDVAGRLAASVTAADS